MPRTSGRESSSRRSRSRHSRSRHRDHHHHSHHRSRSRIRVKNNEKNFSSAVCNMVTIVVLCTALAEPKWIYLKGGGCKIEKEPLNHLGTYQFFYPGKCLPVERTFTDEVTHEVYQFGPNIKDKMDNCVTYKAVLLMKTVIAFCFLAIICSLGAFILDLTGSKNRAAKILRRNAVLSIVTVILSVVINLFCYWLTTEVEDLQLQTKPHHGSKVIVDFDVSFYLITAAGGLSVLATAFNCLRRYPLYEDSQGEPLMDDYDGLEPVLYPTPDLSQMFNIPPPPPPPPPQPCLPPPPQPCMPPPPAYTP